MSYDELRFWIVYPKVTLKKARLPFSSTGRFDGACAAAPEGLEYEVDQRKISNNEVGENTQ